MKMITPELLVRCLREGRDEIQLPPDVVERARRSVERMVAIGKPAGAR
jgi:quinolinate synthase